MTKLFHAFISYGRADSKDFAAKLQQRLHAQGFEVWFDFNDIPLAVDYQNQIDDGIEKAHHFLFIISPHSVNSEYCQKEIQLAIKRNKRIIPLLHVMQISRETWQQRNPNGTEVDWEEYKAKGKHDSYQNMHPVIRKLNWVYFEEDKNDFEKSLADLINLLRSHSEYVEQHTQLLAKALEWERHQKQTSYLLIGEERQQAETWLKFRFKNEQPPCVPTDLHCEYITESIKNANNLMTQVFLSYADEDKAIMEKIRNSLRRESITVWTNTTDIKTGEAFQEAINRGIEQADNLVYLLSPDSLNSTYCQQELALALSLHKRIIPILVRETDPGLVPEALQSLQYIDLTDNVKEEDYQLDESQLLKTLYEDAAYYNEHKILLTKALKWQRQQNNPSILLRGYNLRSAATWLEIAQKRAKHPPTALQQEFIAESQRQPPLESLEVFISYSRADSDLARQLNDSLQMQGKTTWFDQESIASGADFEEEIYRGIKVSDNFLFILSPNSVQSPYCAKEVEYAASLNKRLVTVLHRQVNPGDLHPEFAKVQWLDFNGNQGDFNANFNQLVRTLDTDREHLRSHTKWLQRALEWEENQKNPDRLLRGSELAIARQWLQEAEAKNKRPAPIPLEKEFIEASQEAIEAGIREEKRRVIILKSLLGLVSAAAVIAVVAGFNAVQSDRKAQKAEIQALAQSSEALFDLGEQLDALKAALKAAAKLKATGWDKTDSQLRAEVVTKLQQPLYLIQEVNRLEGHQGKIADVSFSPDGKTIATIGYDDKTVKLWQPNGKVISSKRLENSTGLASGETFSPDGQIIVAYTKDKKVPLWRRDGTFIGTIEEPEGIHYLELSPDSQTIATIGQDRKTIKFWGQDGRLISMLEAEKDKFLSTAFSPDSQTIATINYDEKAQLYLVKLWQRNGTLTATIKGNNQSLTKVKFSPDGAIMATASDNTVKLWRRDGTEIATLLGHKEGINLLQFSPDGQKIVTGSYDGTVKLWQRNGALDLTFKPHGENWVSDVSFSTDSAGNQIMATGSPDKTVKLWQIDGTPIVTLTGHGDWVRKVLFSPDGKNLVSLSEDTTVKLWEVEKKGSIATMPSKDARVFVNPHQTGQILVTTADNNGAVTLWKADVNSTTSVPLVKKGGENVDVQLVDKGQTIVTTVRDDNSFGPVQLWKADGTPVATIIDKTSSPVGVSVSPSGETIVTTVREGNSFSVQLWKADGTFVATIIDKTPSQRVDVDISSDGQTIVTTVHDENSASVQLWKADGTLVATLMEKNNGWASVDLSPDSQTVLTVTADDNEDYTVKLWQADGTLIETLMEKSPDMPHWRFSNDGQMVALLDSDGEVKLWNANGTSIATQNYNTQGSKRIAGFSPDNQTLVLVSQKNITLWNPDGSQKPVVIRTEHKGDISQVVFSPDGQTIATASYDNTVKLWQRNGQLITTYTNDRGVQELYFSTDGKLLASVDEKKTVTWRRIDGMTELEPLVEKGCQWLAGYLHNPFPDEDNSDISQFCADLEHK
ncbi:toll/interleukin-1 receptor domain-containing protein [[Phormidium] sp. ETS-05]|uniref:toll/interleukin-1 receptor domain-containing protein n=1 Tax=[Phormidium] sp. ETS-05 TaxID=222819 RepID=UPI0018EF15E4|nr:TIR domain-containing protein [[Phormidium] sp. ETS-05]